MKASTIVLAVTILILALLCIFFIYLSVRLQSTLINPNNCPKSNAEFGVYPETLGSLVLDTCGPNKNQICTFLNVSNLGQAIDICHQNATICTSFSYSASNIPLDNGTFAGTMSIINYSSGTFQSNTYDTYVQQIPSQVI